MQRLKAVAATPDRPPQSTAPWVFMILIAPFGISSGFLTVALAFHLRHRGVGAESIAALIALSYLPHSWKFLWAPLVDLVGTRRRWYLGSTLLLAIGLGAMGLLAQDAPSMPLLTAAVLAANLAATFSGMSVESLMAHLTAPGQRGRAGGWFQAGNLGGQGVGGGLALWLMQQQGFSALQGAGAMALLCALSCLPLLRLPEPLPAPGAALPSARHWGRQLQRLGADLWSVARSRGGLLAMAVCFLPIGTGGVTNLWSAVAGDWQAGDNTVALVNGVLGGLVSAFGCLLGGRLCDRMDRKRAYCLFGALQVALALGMALAPRTEACFVGFALAYALAQGLSYAGFTGVVLEVIGRGAAATKYNLLASLSNMPIAYVTYVDGWVHGWRGAGAMLLAEAGLGASGLLVFALLALPGWRRAAPRSQ